ncbi:hypothetical protein GCM10009850_111400 [Nonomuraea monospora]|uniref:Uncharacterized protein n=1 Tax=Nonomuraea monospora TaxID=568818 RepID=A0ABP5PVA7_9ACTN
MIFAPPATNIGPNREKRASGTGLEVNIKEVMHMEREPLPPNMTYWTLKDSRSPNASPLVRGQRRSKSDA